MAIWVLKNQTICVQLRGKNEVSGKHEFIWGINNAAPLYKVKIQNDNNTIYNIVFESPLRDVYEHPLAGTIVEIISPDILLRNGEMVAATTGILGKVTSSFSNADNKIQVNIEGFDSFGKIWDPESATSEVSRITPPHYYLRVWKGISRDPSENVIESFDPTLNETVQLGTTGLTVSISGSNIYQGQYWIFSVRPNTPEQIYPWRITKEAIPPMGIKRYFAPLALIKWTKVNGEITGKIVSDCRKKYRPLTDLSGCCTYHVGDGVVSFGDFNSLEEAILNLPESGGKICLLKGIHDANVNIVNRADIQISGCGYYSILRPNEKNISSPIIFIENSIRISINNINFIAPSGIAIYLKDNNHKKSFSQEIKIDHNWFVSYTHAIRIETQLISNIENRIQISNNVIGMINRPDGDVAIYCRSNSALIERNNIRTFIYDNRDPNDPVDPEDPNDPTDPCFNPLNWYRNKFYLDRFLFKYFKNINATLNFNKVQFFTKSGIQIGPFSKKILISENTVTGGKGQGITLGNKLNLNKEVEDPFGPVKLKFQFGRAIVDGTQNKVSSLKLKFEGPGGTTYLTQTNTQGEYFLDKSNTLPGEYLITSLNEEYSIVRVDVQDHDDVNNYNDIIVKRNPKERSTILLEDIIIKSNHIESMGLNGIGCYEMIDFEERLTKVIIENLEIENNNINNCIRQIPNNLPRDFGQLFGLGGLAFSSVENCRIHANQILNNGLNAAFPICGIFIQKAEYLVISNNQITNNGQILTNRTELNAGIYIKYVIPQFNKSNYSEKVTTKALFPLKQSNFACQIHENIVIHPFGLSLGMQPFGATSVTDNYFETKNINHRNIINQIAGSVYINSFGKSLQKAGVPIKFSNMINTTVNKASDTYSTKAAVALPSYSGEVLFSNNQIHLDNRIELSNFIRSSITIASLGDVSFINNQTSISRSISSFRKLIIFTNAWIVAHSIRTNNNRFQEPDRLVRYSVISRGILNSALGNQADHCIISLGYKTIPTNHFEESNIIVNDRLCNNDKNIFIEEAKMPLGVKRNFNN